MAPGPSLDPPPARGGLIALGLAIVVVLLYGLRLPFGWAILGAVPPVGLFLAAPWIARRSLRAHDRDVTLLLARGQATALPGRYRRALGLRWFAPTPLRTERLGFALAENGEPAAALAAYREAVESYDEMRLPPTPAALHGLARVAAELGRWEEAALAWRRLQRQGASVPDLARRLAEAEQRISDPTPASLSSEPSRGVTPAESVPPRPAER